MAIPSGSGTEVLKRTTIHAQANTATAFRWDGTMATVGTSTYTVPTNHIITVLSIFITDQANSSKLVHVYQTDGSNNHYLVQSQTVPAYGTFILNDRFVLTSGDKLIVTADSGSNFDCYCSYIEQDWS
tara:strand:- start:629 stop:1012 length:384 start_codon:yes stop_codon:yes gene_type:complete